MKKIDLRKELKHLYNPSPKTVSLVKVPRFNFLMIDGVGDPNTSSEFQEAIQALFAVSYTLKFMFKREKKLDYPVMALEGLWWMDDMSEFDMNKKDLWKWTLMMMQPKVVTTAAFRKALSQAQEKKNLPALSKLRFEAFQEGTCIQIMHIGPFSDEGPTIEKLHAYAKELGFKLRGKHHEIYMSDWRRVKPEKMKTVLRQPVTK